MPGPSGEACEHCYFWVRDQFSHAAPDWPGGTCFRYPPQVPIEITDPLGEWAFSSVNDEDWCGEYRKKETS